MTEGDKIQALRVILEWADVSYDNMPKVLEAIENFAEWYADARCDDCDRGDCSDCQREPMHNEGFE